jgi:hypothetical protein
MKLIIEVWYGQWASGAPVGRCCSVIKQQRLQVRNVEEERLYSQTAVLLLLVALVTFVTE